MASPIDFPTGPQHDQIHTHDDIVYIYDATAGAWRVLTNEYVQENKILTQSDSIALAIAMS